ncbi:MAG: ATP-binding protein [Pseudomonadota bacterium]
MAHKSADHDKAAELRTRAEIISGSAKAAALKDIPPAELGELLHELRVHQIELEIQNEELRRAQVELDAARAKYFDLYDLAPVGYLTIGEKGFILEANLTAAALLGTARSALTAQPLSRFIHQEDQDIYYKHRHKLFGTGEPQVCELRMMRADGPPFWARLDATVAPGDDGAPVCRCVLSDIDARKRAEEEKDKLQAQLRQAHKMEAVGTLASGIAHEFNNLLQVIIGFTQILMMDRTSRDPEYRSLVAIQTAGSRASSLVHRLLQFSRHDDANRNPVNLNRSLQMARGLIERTIPATVALELRTDARLWDIKADQVRMEQVLLHLATNAADAMPEGGRLVLETENIVLDEEYAQAHPGVRTGRFVLLTVSDTGRGMDRETLEKIFDPFFTTKDVGQGTGLGLASVYGIVKSHGGSIDCSSELGRGTTFKIYLPAMEQPEIDEGGEVAAKPPFPGGAETILLVDDETAIRDFAAHVLNKFGYKVLIAAGGEEALAIHADKSNKIDLVILDMDLPGMEGQRRLRELLRIDPATRVIIAGGDSVADRVGSALKAGAARHVDKPYQVKGLLDAVRAVLDGQG